MVTPRIRIEKLVYEGWGIGHNESGRTLFVKKAVPGDIVDVEIIKDKKSYAECKINRLVESSPKRIYPACPHFNQCGGCDHQNIAYPEQLKIKGGIFKETLARQGINTLPEPIIPGSAEDLFYRNSIRFFFYLDSENRISFARQSSGDLSEKCSDRCIFPINGLMPIDRCLLQSETANQIMLKLAKCINKTADNKAGFWQLKIREGKKTAEFMVEIITSAEELPGQKEIISSLKTIPEIKSIYHTIAPAKSLKNLRRRLIFGSPIIHEKVGPFTFQISPESFFQTNSLGVKTLYDTIKNYADVKMGDRVLDLFCGTGTIGIYLSTLAKEVVGVEIIAEAIRDARDNTRLNKVHNCTFICHDSEEYLQTFDVRHSDFDIIIVDPPRAGLTRKIIELLSRLVFSHSHTKIIYVSCNPATFSRDVKLLEENGIMLKKVQPIDMFPQTHHIECVGLLMKSYPQAAH